MIIAGMISPPSSQNNERVQKITYMFRRYAPIAGSIINKNNFFLITGKRSENDYDICLTKKDVVLIGRVFENNQSEPIDEHDFKQLSFTNILSHYWGKYLLFTLGDHVSILRDPTGQLPLFYYQYPDGFVIFSSEISLLRDILGIELGYNWAYLSSYIIYNNNSLSTQTAFHDIYEVPPGCALTMGDIVDVKNVWDPFQLSCADKCSYDAIPKTVANIVSSWTRDYDNIFLNFSGGLDSTALLYALSNTQKSHQTLKAINFFHPEIRTSDETEYADNVCNKLNIDLIKIDMTDHLPLSPLEGKISLKPNKPWPMLTHASLMKRLHEIVDAQPASLLVSGQGGDHVFICPPSETILIDYFIDKGLGGLKKHLSHLSQYYRTSYYQVIKSALQSLLRYRFSNAKHTYRSHINQWMTKSFQEKGRHYLVHPRYDQLSKQSHLAKFLHIESIDHGLCSIALELGDHNPIFSPLLYQPLLEIALTIPAYDMLHHSYDRYPFRKSMSTAFQTDHVWRRSKGETTGITQLGLRKNFNYVKDLCLDGRLSQEGFINKDILERQLWSFSRGDNISFWSLMNLVSTEMFIEAWK